jgi:hypothetical protein
LQGALPHLLRRLLRHTDVSAQYPEECLRAAEAASERALVFGPTGSVLQYPITGAVGDSTQKVIGGPGPGAAFGHDVPHESGDLIGRHAVRAPRLRESFYSLRRA